MSLFQIFFPKGWRRTGTINVILAYVCDLILLVLFSISVSRPGASLSGSTIIFNGNCNLSTGLNLLLHLSVNIVAAVILASSNFFMQVLNSPSRKENLRFVSWFKSISWLIFFFSSIPIHLFFNGVIFHTAYEGSQWHLTIATEAFITGAPYFPPGASLAPAGAAGPGYQWIELAQGYTPPNGTSYGPHWREGDEYPINGYTWKGCADVAPILGYGEPVTWDHYLDALSTVRRNITSVAVEAGAWDFLDATSCQTEYLSCKPRTDYSDVVVIIDLGGSAGWTRSEVFDFVLSSVHD
ncbi:hypothetical protein F4824DRAFT_503476 [Ustulina deusta]|nr:hypothetical protein F4824DRAFT_503476 [Ustulina deusta]